eukprot:TRINITY_DN14753_c0_g1_i2.p2 TRINITY_DN14753_c0_g1~~TRINITY_DN14753_c0_g1_i2.p2  ORF type:complete len:149 (-),score=48.86 TRINITY_DN14753_c0_g1_i2:11-457(-)
MQRGLVGSEMCIRDRYMGTLITNDINGPKEIPEGTYDVGDGYYDPLKEKIYEYSGEIKRELEADEKEWIMSKCRYNPSLERASKMTGESDPIIKKMIELNSEKGSQPLPVSYTHLTLPTILLVQISVVAVSLKKKKASKSRETPHVSK